MVIPKLTALFFLYIFYTYFFNLPNFYSHDLLALVGIFSIIIGTFALFYQSDIKRFLAFSGISHLGFILLGLFCDDISSFLLYTIIYSITTINIFMILIFYTQYLGKEVLQINQLYGLPSHNPYLAICFASALFSLAGVPPFLGFYAKFFVITSYLKYLFFLPFFAILFSTIACAIYLRMLQSSQFELTNNNNPIHPSI